MTCHSLYRMFDAEGALLYIGASANLPDRVEQHRRSKEWWREVATIQAVHFDSIVEVRRAEAQAINTESPRYNNTRPDSPARRGWENRYERRRYFHASGRYCWDGSCRECLDRKTAEILARKERMEEARALRDAEAAARRQAAARRPEDVINEQARQGSAA